MASDKSEAERILDAVNSDLPTVAETAEGSTSRTAALAEQLDPNIAQAISSQNQFVIDAIRGGARTNEQILQALIDANVSSGDLPPGLQSQYEELRQRQMKEQEEFEQRAELAARRAEDQFVNWANAGIAAVLAASGPSSGGSHSSSNYSKMSEEQLMGITAQQWGNMSANDRIAAVDRALVQAEADLPGVERGLRMRLSEMDERYKDDPELRAKIDAGISACKGMSPEEARQHLASMGLTGQALDDALEVIKLTTIIDDIKATREAAIAVKNNPNDRRSHEHFDEVRRSAARHREAGRGFDTERARIDGNTEAMRHTDDPEQRRAHAVDAARAYARIKHKVQRSEEAGREFDSVAGRHIQERNRIGKANLVQPDAPTQSNAQKTITVDPRMQRNLAAIGASPDDELLVDPSAPAVAAKPAVAAPAHTQTA